MKLSRTAIKELTAAYRVVLKHAFIASMGIAIISPAMAETYDGTKDAPTNITENKTFTENVSVSNYTNPSASTNSAVYINKDVKVNFEQGLTLSNNKQTKALHNAGGDVTILGSVYVTGNNNDKSGTSAGIVNHGIENGADLKQSARFTINAGDDGVIEFSKNNAVGTGVALYNEYSTATMSAGKIIFDGNELQFSDAPKNGYGANIFNSGTLEILGAENTFTNNKDYSERNVAQSGGAALQSRGNNNHAAIATIGKEDGSSVNKFSNNMAQMNGGAVLNRNKSDIVFNGKTTFENNSATTGHGGAIYNYGQTDTTGAESPTITFNGDVTFKNNHAVNGDGGAIWNDTDANQEATATITFNGKSVFENNTAAEKGGAIFNGIPVSMSIADATFTGNSTIKFAGAIHNSGTLTLSKSIFTGNHSMWAGAIYSGTNSNLTIDDSMFSDNYADEIGAVGVFKNAKISNTTFKNNVAKSKEEDAEGAGAMFFGALSHSTVTDSTFENNKSAVNGGAIVTRSALLANNTDAELDITDSVFKDNFAEINGGAIYNSFYHSVANANAVTVSGSTFVNNTANNGGAIYNDGTQDKGGHSAAMHLENVTFTNNIAKITGGAIYNSKDASMELAGENVFSGNRRGSLGNDIYNDGAFTITGGTTTIDGGIIGNDGTFTLADGATLNMGATAIQQKTINIDGIVNADILNAREYGRLLGDVTFGDDAQLNLTVATAGTYKIFDADNNFANINAGDLFNVQNNGAAGVVISTKDTGTLASEKGLSTQAAAALVAIANAGGVASSASIAAQNALASGNVEYVEAESAKIAPVNKPVVHSVSTSVQNQVLSLVASRMSGGVVGRSGGDFVTTGSGMWAHGLINRSKMNGAFHGDTRGVAFGIDATFNRKYTFGMGYAHDNTDVHAGAQKTDIDSDTLFAYAQYKPNKWFINGAFNYTFADYTDKSDLFGINISSNHNVDSYGVQLLSGYDFASGVTPSVGARFLHVAQDEYTNGLVNVKASDTDFWTGVAGVKYAFDIVATPELTFSPELRAAAKYDFMSDNATATVLVPGAAAYVVDSDRLSRFGGEFGISMSALYRGITVSLNYDLDLHKDYTSQTGMLKFRYNF